MIPQTEEERVGLVKEASKLFGDAVRKLPKEERPAEARKLAEQVIQPVGSS